VPGQSVVIWILAALLLPSDWFVAARKKVKKAQAIDPDAFIFV
jgi:hypothetical protein